MNNDSSLIEDLRKLEESLTKPDVRRSPDALAQLIADDFREFGSSGAIFDKEQIIAELQQQKRCEIALRDFQAVFLAPDVVLATYLATAQFAHSATALNSLRSSIWARRDGEWQVVFHQGTPTEVNATK